MKSVYALVLLAFASYQANAEEVNPHIGKLLDGASAYCIADEDVGTLAFGPTKAVVNANEDSLEMQISLRHIVCQKTARGYGWVARKSGASIVGVARDGSRMVTHVQSPEIYFIQNTVDKSVVNEPARYPLKKLASQTVTHRMPMMPLLRANTSEVVFEFFERSTVTVVNKGKVVDSGRYSSGAYRLSFTLDDSSGKVEVRNLILR